MKFTVLETLWFVNEFHCVGDLVAWDWISLRWRSCGLGMNFTVLEMLWLGNEFYCTGDLVAWEWIHCIGDFAAWEWISLSWRPCGLGMDFTMLETLQLGNEFHCLGDLMAWKWISLSWRPCGLGINFTVFNCWFIVCNRILDKTQPEVKELSSWLWDVHSPVDLLRHSTSSNCFFLGGGLQNLQWRNFSA